MATHINSVECKNIFGEHYNISFNFYTYNHTFKSKVRIHLASWTLFHAIKTAVLMSIKFLTYSALYSYLVVCLVQSYTVELADGN